MLSKKKTKLFRPLDIARIFDGLQWKAMDWIEFFVLVDLFKSYKEEVPEIVRKLDKAFEAYMKFLKKLGVPKALIWVFKMLRKLERDDDMKVYKGTFDKISLNHQGILFRVNATLDIRTGFWTYNKQVKEREHKPVKGYGAIGVNSNEIEAEEMEELRQDRIIPVYVPQEGISEDIEEEEGLDIAPPTPEWIEEIEEEDLEGDNNEGQI